LVGKHGREDRDLELVDRMSGFRFCRHSTLTVRSYGSEQQD
jgi:hypothetical protein